MLHKQQQRKAGRIQHLKLTEFNSPPAKELSVPWYIRHLTILEGF